MRRIFSLLILVLFPSMAAADCVSYNFEPDPGSGFAGFGRFENSCSYQVVIWFRYSDGQSGLAGPIRPGQTERGYHGEAKGIEYTWCDFDASACTPNGFGERTSEFKAQRTEQIEEVNQITRELSRIQRLAREICAISPSTDSQDRQCLEYIVAEANLITERYDLLRFYNLYDSTDGILPVDAADETGFEQDLSSDGDVGRDDTTSASGDDIVPACTDISRVSSNHTYYSFSGGCGRVIYCEVYDRNTGERTASEFFNNSNMFHDAYRLVCSE